MNKVRHISIKWKLGFMLLSMVIVPTLFLGVLTYLTFEKEVVGSPAVYLSYQPAEIDLCHYKTDTFVSTLCAGLVI